MDPSSLCRIASKLGASSGWQETKQSSSAKVSYLEEETMTELVRLRTIRPLEGFAVEIEFTNGTRRVINLEPYLHGPVFEPIRNDKALFRALYVDQETKTLTWPDEVDIDPDVLYYGLTPAWAEGTEAASLFRRPQESRPAEPRST